jgi:hypothetical protein
MDAIRSFAPKLDGIRSYANRSPVSGTGRSSSPDLLWVGLLRVAAELRHAGDRQRLVGEFDGMSTEIVAVGVPADPSA